MHNKTDRIDDILGKEPDVDELSVEETSRLLDSWKIMLSTRNGRVIVRDLLQLSHFGRSAQAGKREETDYNTGKQAIGEYLMEKINMCYPEAYALMLKEAREDLDNDRERRTNHTSGNTSA